jgi:hypothetical protein
VDVFIAVPAGKSEKARKKTQGSATTRSAFAGMRGFRISGMRSGSAGRKAPDRRLMYNIKHTRLDLILAAPEVFSAQGNCRLAS